jgi:hypothetical protein
VLVVSNGSINGGMYASTPAGALRVGTFTNADVGIVLNNSQRYNFGIFGLSANDANARTLGFSTARWLTLFTNNIDSTGSIIHTGSVSILSGSVSIVNGGFTGSLFGTSSIALTALTASYFDGFITFPSGLDITGSLVVTGSQIITGSLNVITGGITGSLLGSSSFATTASFAVSASWAPSVGGVTSITTGNGLAGGPITSTGTITLDTGSVHFLDGVKKELNTEGVVSSSTQVTYTQLQNIPVGIVSSSTQVTALLPTGTVSSSLQINTGSFSGSFVGSLLGSSSFSTTASAATSITFTPSTASFAITSSYVLPTGLPTGTVSSSLQINTGSFTGSFVGLHTGSYTGSFTGTLVGSASSAITASAATSITFTPSTASFAITASAATSITFIPTTASFAVSASWAPSTGGGLTTKAGSIANTSFTGNPRKAAVNFSTAFTNTNYAVVITGEDARSWTVEGKVVGGFTASANSNTSLTGITYWIATAYGES